MNHTSDDGLVNLRFHSECPHQLPRILIGTIDEFRHLDKAILLTYRFLYETVATSNLTAFNSLLKLKTNDRARFQNAVVFKSECSSFNETMTAIFFLFSVSLGSDKFIRSTKCFITMMCRFVLHLYCLF